MRQIRLLTVAAVISFTLVGMNFEEVRAEQLFLTEDGDDITMRAVNGNSDNEGNATGRAIEGVNTKSGARGTLGHKGVGVRGSSSFIGVHGLSTSDAAGVMGQSNSGAGVWGTSTATGVFGKSTGGGSGVVGSNSTSGAIGQLGGIDFGVKSKGDMIVEGDAKISGDVILGNGYGSLKERINALEDNVRTLEAILQNSESRPEFNPDPEPGKESPPPKPQALVVLMENGGMNLGLPESDVLGPIVVSAGAMCDLLVDQVNSEANAICEAVTEEISNIFGLDVSGTCIIVETLTNVGIPLEEAICEVISGLGSTVIEDFEHLNQIAKDVTVRWTGLSRQKTGLFKVDLLSVIVWLFHTFSLQNRLF